MEELSLVIAHVLLFFQTNTTHQSQHRSVFTARIVHFMILLLLVENWLSQQMFLVVRRLLISTLRMVEREEEVCECRGSAAK